MCEISMGSFVVISLGMTIAIGYFFGLGFRTGSVLIDWLKER